MVASIRPGEEPPPEAGLGIEKSIARPGAIEVSEGRDELRSLAELL